MDLTEINKLTEQIIGAAIDVHKELGPGLTEAVYEICLLEELERRGLSPKRQVDFPVYYKGVKTNKHLRIDLVVNDIVIVELKSVSYLIKLNESQLLTYLKLTNRPVGLLINFNVPKLVDGLKRMINL